MKFRIAIFASGTGSNAVNLVNNFDEDLQIEVAHLYSNKADAAVLEKMDTLGIPTSVFSLGELKEGDIAKSLIQNEIDYVVLAGFLWLIPISMIAAFPERIINIHPALLPKYGGKGMYGSNVHQAVLQASEKESGITIHLVDAEYDKGAHLFQAKTGIVKGETVESLSTKIHLLEHKHFPQVVRDYILNHTAH